MILKRPGRTAPRTNLRYGFTPHYSCCEGQQILEDVIVIVRLKLSAQQRPGQLIRGYSRGLSDSPSLFFVASDNYDLFSVSMRQRIFVSHSFLSYKHKHTMLIRCLLITETLRPYVVIFFRNADKSADKKLPNRFKPIKCDSSRSNYVKLCQF